MSSSLVKGILGAVGTIVAGAAVTAIVVATEKSKAAARSKSPKPYTHEDLLNDQKAERTRRERVRAERENVLDLALSSYKGGVPLNLLPYLMRYCDLKDVCNSTGVCRAWNRVSSHIRNDITYIRECAIRGFRDGINGFLRGSCWKVILDGEGLISTVSRVPDEEGAQTFYWMMLSRPFPEKVLESIETIKKDVPRTLIHRHAFTNDALADSTLTNVLSVYCLHDPDTGYCQGMNYVAGYLLTKLDQESAYWCLYLLMTNEKHNLRSFFKTGLRGYLKTRHIFDQLFRLHLPDLYTHFEKCSVSSDMLTEWLMTFYTFPGFPRRATDRIWDWFIVDGHPVIHRVALAILAQSRDTLLAFEMDDIIYYLKQLPDQGVLEPDLLIGMALSYDINDTDLQELGRQFEIDNPVQPIDIDQHEHNVPKYR